MKRLFSTKYSAGAFNTALLILRFVAAGLMIRHGYIKIISFNIEVTKMISLFGISPKICLLLVIFAEFFCSILLIIGLFTRLACIPLVITMAVALFIKHDGHFFGDGQIATIFLACYAAIFLLGPGRISIDSMIGK